MTQFTCLKDVSVFTPFSSAAPWQEATVGEAVVALIPTTGDRDEGPESPALGGGEALPVPSGWKKLVTSLIKTTRMEGGKESSTFASVKCYYYCETYDWNTVIIL